MKKRSLRKQILAYLWKKCTQGTIYSVETIAERIMRIVAECRREERERDKV